MDPQLANMIRNITGLWMMSSLYYTAFLFYRKRIRQERGFWWHLTGILTVFSSMEMGADIFYIWAWHGCPGFILKDDWLNWLPWSLMLIFIALVVIIALKSGRYAFFLMILLFSMNFGNVESIIFLLPVLKIILFNYLF